MDCFRSACPMSVRVHLCEVHRRNRDGHVHRSEQRSGASCEEELTKGKDASRGDAAAVGAGFAPQGHYPVGDLGVRIRLVGGTDKNAPCGSQYVECYDANNRNMVLFTFVAGTPRPLHPWSRMQV